MNLKNWVDSEQILTTPGLVTLSPAAYFAVDVFFWIGGFLITIGLVAKMRKSKAVKLFLFRILLYFILLLFSIDLFVFGQPI